MIGVIGVGHVGLSLTAALANVGYDVIAFDIEQTKCNLLQQDCEPYIYEPGLRETLKRCKSRITFASNYDSLMEKCSTIMITVGTPIGDNGKINLDYLDKAVTAIGKRLRKGQLIILKSTVVPGTSRNVASKLEKMSHLKAGTDFYVAYCPERTIEGLALYELYTLPKIIGGINAESTERASLILKKLGGKTIKVSSPEVAELCKMADNLYRATNIALANELGCICEDIGIDAYEVVSAVNEAYERTHLFKPGLGADGPCLSKDSEILRSYANERGINTEVISACINRNKESTLRVASIISDYIKLNKIEKPVIALIGLAFKGFPETGDLRGSPAIKIRDFLQSRFKNLKFKYHDPILKEFQGSTVSPTLTQCIHESNIVAFLTNHPHFMNIDVRDILNLADRPLLVIDCWHNIENAEEVKENKNVRIVRIGDGRLWKC